MDFDKLDVLLRYKNLFQDILGTLWMTFVANFGWKPRTMPDEPNGSQSLRLIVVLCLLSGTVISCAYRASLTSELAVRWQRWPVNSPEEVLESNYKVISSPGTVMQAHLENSPPASVLNKIWQTGRVSYVHNTDLIDYMIQHSHSENIVLYGTSSFRYRAKPEDRCKVSCHATTIGQ